MSTNGEIIKEEHVNCKSSWRRRNDPSTKVWIPIETFDEDISIERKLRGVCVRERRRLWCGKV